MTAHVDTNPTISAQEMEARYQRAQTLIQGYTTTNLVKNDAIFPTWVEGGDCFWYERTHKTGKEYRLVNAKSATNKIAFDHDEFAIALAKVSGQKVNAKDLPISHITITLSPLTVFFTAFDKRWSFEQDATVCQEVDAVPENWVISPDGNQVIFTREFNLWVRDLSSGEEWALTGDGEDDLVYAIEGEGYGHSTDLWGKRAQACWSPDS